MRLASGDSASIEEVRGMMERQTQLLVSLVDDLLDVSRITRGKVELKRARVDLRQVIERALDGVRSSVRDAGLDLTVAFPDAPIPLDADPIRLAQVFANLLHNAVKYTPRGGRIWMSAERLEEEALVVVRDTGVGIPPEMQQRVFDMFAQLDASVEKDHSGLGIGLTLVRSLVDMHGGRVEVRSEGAGHGSEFRVWLPVAAGPPALETPPEKGEEATGGAEARRVLIVDDNRAAAETLRLVLTMAGHEVRVAYDGEEGLAAAAGFRPEVVLMDLGMPRMDGYEAAQRLREQPGGREILLIALSGWGQLHDKARTSKAGFDHHLVKPAEPALLRALLAEWPRRSP
jgi:CheY-like chemotaxis protein